MKIRETRLSFRPRPLDINKQLEIVRDSKDLDSQDGVVSRDITHSHEALDKDNEAVSAHFLATAQGRIEGGRGSAAISYALGCLALPVLQCLNVSAYVRILFPIWCMAGSYGGQQEGQGREGDPDS
jgi:hypothetical protein